MAQPTTQPTPGFNWIQLAPLRAERNRLVKLTTVAVGRYIYVMGDSDMVQRYDIESNTWTEVPPLIYGRTGLAAAADARGNIFVFGGNEMIGNLEMVRAVEMFDGSRWVDKTILPAPRTGASAITGLDGRIYVLGGHGDIINAVEIYDPVRDSWATGPTLNSEHHFAAAAVDAQGRIYAIGGFGQRVLNSVEIYDPIQPGARWNYVSPLQIARYLHGAATDQDGKIFAIGGSDDPHKDVTTNTVEVYDPRTNIWAFAEPLPLNRSAIGACLGADLRIYAISAMWRDEYTLFRRERIT